MKFLYTFLFLIIFLLTLLVNTYDNEVWGFGGYFFPFYSHAFLPNLY